MYTYIVCVCAGGNLRLTSLALCLLRPRGVCVICDTTPPNTESDANKKLIRRWLMPLHMASGQFTTYTIW